MRLITTTIFAVVSSLALFRCGGSTDAQPDAGDDAAVESGDQTEASTIDAGPDVDNGAPSTTYPAFKIDAPQVQDYGGVVLSTPKVIPIYFASDDTTYTAKITSFLNNLPASTYWPAISSEYLVGAMTVATPIVIQASDTPAPATIDDTAIGPWLASEIAAQTLPAPDANTVYAVFYPSTTTVTLQGDSSCTSFGGYHSSFPQTPTTITYAIVPRCASFNGLNGIDSTTSAASHELIEASTDPHPDQDAAYASVDDDHIIFEFIGGGGEVGDMCVSSQNAYFMPTDIGAMVQRSWSNQAASAGHNPCVPSDGTPYFNSMPVLTDSIAITGVGTTKGAKIPIGQSSTIEIDLFSDAATSGPWTVTATDASSLQQQPTELTFAWDRTTGQNGEKLHLTINAIAKSEYGASAFIIDSKLGTAHNFWAGIVGN